MTNPLWTVLPYVCLTVFVVGHVWRYRTDKFGWTARSSQLHEQRLLRLGSPLFHFGLLATALGHAGGLLVPAGLTEALGVSDSVYHAAAFWLGGLAGIVTVTGLAILVYRRLTVRAVTRSGPVGDLVMYPLLAAVVLMGLWITLTGSGHDYRATVAPWFRSIFMLQPDVAAVDAAPFWFQAHAVTAWLLIACWPFTRLVHVFSLPLTYLTRPYVVYRSR
ncbi:respiratory nitrate reductase subunit gamma [Actinophytocola sp.]|uniref:respiratory nitrate reductase subunit gamma n=1 Tax=Actinophytocola sp. TaxID=1872138 RepID=UPI002D7FE4F9|nr:respiratory nitrate reductase subunit gamma [Actinophytocola sp.]HET9141829.1 respiratory nitrate reductase subunit gamma [Actinophytocola sp.]